MTNMKRENRGLTPIKPIEMTIPDKPQSRLQRYRLTLTGRQLFDQIEGKSK